MLTESQLAALEKAKSEKEAHGEFESECPGYCGAQDTFYVVRAHVSAAGAKGGKKGKRWGARVAASPRKSTQNRTPQATSSPST